MNPILTDGSNDFAHHTVTTRIPGILDDVVAGDNGLPQARRDAVARLREAIAGDQPLRLFRPPAPDWDWWRSRFDAHSRRVEAATGEPPRPLNAEWFFFEHYLYRLLLEATDWWANGIDPFAGAKARELDGAALWDTLGRTLAEGGSGAAARSPASPPAAFSARVAVSLWGNRTDLSYGAVAELGHDETDAAALLLNHLEETWRLLAAQPGSSVHIVCDNAATELAADLALADYLMLDLARPVVLHVKLHPTFVSDATPPDVRDLLARMRGCRLGPEPAAVRELGERLEAGLGEGRLRVVPDQYWNGPDFFDQLPPRLGEGFRGATLVIVKGDMAYRRLLRDTVIHATAPLEDVAPRPPAPFLMLRTMKGDPVAGVAAAIVSRLETEDPRWRVNGRRGLIQLLTPGGDTIRL